MGLRRAALLLPLFSALVFAISCAGEEVATPQSTATSPAAAVPTATAVATATPVPTSTPTPVPPTSTPAPTATPSPAATATAAVAPTPAPTPAGVKLSPETVKALLAEFADDIFIGGQISPRFARWVSDDAFIFIQFNSSKPEDIKEVRYIGVGVKGVFCSETRPDGEKGSFTHFHRYEAAKYSDGHGGQPGAQGYWMTWASPGEFVSGNRTVKPGVDYQFSLLTDIPSCGGYPPEVDFKPEDAGDLTKPEIASLISLFGDQVLFGGQVPPRFSKWVSENAFIFLQFDKSNPAEATSLRYFGIGPRGEYCKEKRPSEDFPHFHKYFAAKYGEGHGSKPHDLGYWLLVLAADEFKSGERQVGYGVDREFSKLEVPACG